MDVHPPHEPIHTAKDFFLHLFTITIGLLIAVGIEGTVEWRHHVHLVEEANETLHEEIKYNLAKVTQALTDLAAERKDIGQDLGKLQNIQNTPNDKNAQKVDFTARLNTFGLHETAWKTAQSTGALSYMPYADAERYAEIYQQQEELLKAQEKMVDDEALLLGLVAKFNLAGSSRITKEQADGLAERYGIWNAHLIFCNLLAKVNAQGYQAFLDNRPAPTEMHESLDNSDVAPPDKKKE